MEKCRLSYTVHRQEETSAHNQTLISLLVFKNKGGRVDLNIV